MVDLRRWLLRHTTPARVAGIVLAVSLAGCRSASIHDEPVVGPDFAEPKPVAPYEDAPTASDTIKRSPNDDITPPPPVEPDTDVASSAPEVPPFEDEPIDVPPFAGDVVEDPSPAESPTDPESLAADEGPQFIADQEDEPAARSEGDLAAARNEPPDSVEVELPMPVGSDDGEKVSTGAEADAVPPLLTDDPLLDGSPFEPETATDSEDVVATGTDNDLTTSDTSTETPMPMPVLPLPLDATDDSVVSGGRTAELSDDKTSVELPVTETETIEDTETKVDDSKPAAPFLPESANRPDTTDRISPTDDITTDDPLPLPLIEPESVADETIESDQTSTPNSLTQDEEVALVIRPGRPGSGQTVNDIEGKTPALTDIQVFAEVNGRADGIVLDKDGNMFVSHRDTISRVSPEGQVTEWARTGAPRGHLALADGTHIVCDASQRAVLKLDADGKVIRKLATRSNGYFLRSPNAVVADHNGGFYFTDPGYARIRNPIGKVHYIAADGQVTPVAQSLAFPEGITISPDGSTLFVAESQRNRVLEFDIKEAGVLGPKRVFCNLPQRPKGAIDDFADGIAIDREGRVYVAHHGMSRIEVIGRDGQWRTSIQTAGSVVSDLAFDRDYSRLFVTGAADRGAGRGQVLVFKVAGRGESATR